MNERAEDWAAEFAESTAFSLLPDGVKSHASQVAAEFLRRAGEPTEESARRVMLEEMPALDLPKEVREESPLVIRTFLEWLQDGGRLGDGHALGKFVWALGPAYRERCSPKGGARNVPFVKKTSDIGRNDPCPCGSGRKYKKCCLK